MQSEAIKVAAAGFLSFMLISRRLHIHPDASVCSMSPLIRAHAPAHTLALNIKQLLLVCDIITPAGETQARQAGVIAVTRGERVRS